MAVRVQGERFDIHAGFDIVFLYSSLCLKLSPPIPRGPSVPLTTFGFGTPELDGVPFPASVIQIQVVAA